MLSQLYEARLRRVITGDVVVLCVELGFDVSIDVKIRLHGVNVTENAEAFVYDWLSGQDRVYVKTVQTVDHLYSGLIFSDRQLTACLNDDLIDSGFANPYAV